MEDSLQANDQFLLAADMGNAAEWSEAWPFETLSLNSPFDRDYFLFNIETILDNPFWIDLEFENSNFDLDLYLYDERGELILASVNGLEGETEAIDLAVLEPGVYILEVSPYDGNFLEAISNTSYSLLKRAPEGPIQLEPSPTSPDSDDQISIEIVSLGPFVAGVESEDIAIQENKNILLADLNYFSFLLQAELNITQLALLQQDPPIEPIRFRIGIAPVETPQQQGLEENDFIFEVKAIDFSEAQGDPNSKLLGVDLLPDSEGFFEWPIFDRQNDGQGFIIPDLIVNVFPVADGLEEGLETGSFSIMDLNGAFFSNLLENEADLFTNTAQIAVLDYPFQQNSAEFSLDVDGDGLVTPLGDGLMIIRKLFGEAFAGSSLTNKAISQESTRTSGQIHDFIQNGIDLGFLDIDRDGFTTPLGDGLMVIRHLFGSAFEGTSLTSKAIGELSPYFGLDNSHHYISDHINSLLPSSAANLE